MSLDCVMEGYTNVYLSMKHPLKVTDCDYIRLTIVVELSELKDLPVSMNGKTITGNILGTNTQLKPVKSFLIHFSPQHTYLLCT